MKELNRLFHCKSALWNVFYSFLGGNNETRNSVINSQRFTNENADLERAHMII